ncbi:Hypothetical Protein FCC1311_099622 [Hondaea fermentalgiana]|uniref:Uncharacterized protein n=1 Tax=Hondaea fermentalgiana TaxID=2315210 RepID=A0A2R5GTU1_9STRA|nr:Hypothetical Protein FCC1311_099622 [Hondaea fermentalgiana]|eukprot:GBG33739.1 Hypothetical Protein FCC1311_099622 [Hondaea fermentalgiana]
MEERLDTVLAVAGSVKNFLLPGTQSCMQNGDLVSQSLLTKSAVALANDEDAEDVDTNGEDDEVDSLVPSEAADLEPAEGVAVPESMAATESGAAADTSSVGGSVSVAGGVSLAGLSQEAHAPSQSDALSLISADTAEISQRTARRKQNYLSVAGANEERTAEAMLVHLSGGFIATSTKEQLGKAFYDAPCTAIAIVRSGNVEWLVSGFAVATGAQGSQATLWRGCKFDASASAPATSNGAAVSPQLVWFDLDSTVESAISICYKVPDRWAQERFYGVFPEQDEDEDDDEVEQEDYDESPQYVLSARGNVDVQAIVTFELLNDINFIKGTGMDIYAVPGEEYEACDDPRAFWTRDFLVQTCIPATRKSSMTGLRLELKADSVYMLVPFCTQPLQFCIRVASEYELDAFDLGGDGSSDGNSDVGSLY